MVIIHPRPSIYAHIGSCPTLDPLTDPNATISYNPIMNVVTYGCDAGYSETITGDKQRTCQGNGSSEGTWTGSETTVTCTSE